MTENQSILSSLDFSFFHPLVTLADGSITFIQSIDPTNATSSLSLSYVLYVLTFPLI